MYLEYFSPSERKERRSCYIKHSGGNIQIIQKMKNISLQDTLTSETPVPEEVLKRAKHIELSKLTTVAVQVKIAAAAAGSSTNDNSGRKIN